MADVRSRLASVFGGNTGGATQGNDPLRYQPPKEPSRGAQSHVQATQPAASAATPSVTNAVVFYTAVSLYQYDTATRKYVQQGTATSTTVGCVLVGAEVTYSVLLYTADKTTLCEVPLKAWKPTVQPKHYMNFYDERGTNWSLKFPSDDALVEFMRQVFLVKIHAEIWSPTRSLDANALLKEEIGASAIKATATTSDDAATKAVAQGDTVGVEFKCWRVVGNAKAPPNDIVTKYPPFEKASETELRKFRIGDGSERIKALEESVVGMKRGGRRMVLAPPGKTNGQDWYLIDVTLVKTKSGGRRSSERSAASAADPAAQTESAPASESRKSRRKSSPSSNSNGDMIRVEEDEKSKDDADLKERLRQLEFELQQRAFAEGGAGRHAGMPPNGGSYTQAAPSAAQYPSMYGGGGPPGGLGNSGYTPYGSMFQPAQGMMMASSGRPVDTMIMELHAKIDYLIRMAPTGGVGGGSANSFGGPVGATDVQFVLRGVERLAGENERLLLQINSQTQQYSAYERRVEELLKHNQRLQDEKRVADEKYQSMASLQLNYNAEISSLTSAKEAAITQTNRLHAEYQQLLTAYYQKQQASSESEEQRNALDFERQARARAEKELQREALTRSVAEQELTLAKKQLDVFTKRKDAEMQSHRHELEQQLQATKTSYQRDVDDRVKQVTAEYQQQETRLQQEWTAQMDRQATQFQAQIETLKSQVANEGNVKEQLEIAEIRVRELEMKLATQETSMVNEAAAVGLPDEEKRIYTAQIDLLQQQVKDLEAEKFERVQQDLSSGRLGSPTSSPRIRKKLEGGGGDEEAVAVEAEQRMAIATAKEEAAERTLALAQEIKREAEAMMASANGKAAASGDASHSHSHSQGQGAREKAVALFKEGINEVFFRFQDVFEDEAHAGSPLEPKQVLSVIRKVLKQSTKDVVHRLQEEEVEEVPAAFPSSLQSQPLPSVEEEPAPTKFTLEVPLAFGLAAAAVGAGAVANGSNDEPPPPPELQSPAEHQEEKAEEPESKASAISTEKTEKKEEAEEDEATGDDLLFGSGTAGGGPANSTPLPFAVQAVETDDDSDDDFED